MRRLVTAAGASVLLTLAAACAQQSDAPAEPAGGQDLSTSAEAPPPAAGGGNSAGSQQAPVGGKRVAPAQVDAQALPADYPRKVWTLRDGRTVAAYGQRGGCGTVRLEVESQTEKQVRLRFVEKQPDANQVCTMELHQEPITTPLDEPLGNRKLVLDLAKV